MKTVTATPILVKETTTGRIIPGTRARRSEPLAAAAENKPAEEATPFKPVFKKPSVSTDHWLTGNHPEKESVKHAAKVQPRDRTIESKAQEFGLQPKNF